MIKVFIDPADDILYKSFYIYGLEQMFGKRNVCFSPKYFEDLSKKSRNTKSMRFVTKDGLAIKRYVISCNDSYNIIEELYNWCDVYGSVNANRALTANRFYDKLVSLCPSFALKCWNPIEIMFHCITNLPVCQSNYKKYLGKHKRLLQRQKYSEYCSLHESLDKYVFTCSTLWYNDEWNKNDEGVNLSRAHFIRACKSIKELCFEGGLVSSVSTRSSDDLFQDCLTYGVTTNQWLGKTKQSMCVFNTPAFWKCHGWKLGEYMALGKAIISTPLSNDLPCPLIHGENIWFVENNEQSMREAVILLMNDSKLRQRLEQGISTYWEQYGTPQASLRLLGIEQ